MDRYQRRMHFKRGAPVYPDGKNRNAARIAKLTKRLVAELQDLGAYVYHVGIYGSTYIKFTHPRLGSLRIADHPGRPNYSYRFNIDLSISEAYQDQHIGKTRYHFPLQDRDQFVAKIREYARQVREGFDDDALWND